MLDFIKKNPGILSSLVLTILIPTLIFFNLFFIISAFQEHIDDTLYSKAILGQTIFGVLASEYIDNPEGIQEQIVKIGKIDEGEAIVDLQVIVPEQQGFKIKAAKDQEKIGTMVPVDPTIIMPWYQGRPFRHLRMEGNERVWFVVDAFYDEKGERLGLISLTLSLARTDALVFRTIWWTYILLVGTVIIVLILVAHHTKLFTYIILYNKLKEVDKMKDDFIRMATHELQSPITAVKGYVEALEEEETATSLTDKKKEFFNRIKISTRTLSDLVYDILQVAQFEQGELDFTPQKIFPDEIITEIIQGFRVKSKQKGVDLFFEDTKERPYYIQANSHRFHQILTNLIENAIKYTPRGNIWVRTKKDEDKKQYIIEVEDSGIGIAAEHRERLFEKFYRIKSKETAQIPGSGLGLWLTKQLVEKSKGKIFVESIKGVATKFIIIFPLIKE